MRRHLPITILFSLLLSLALGACGGSDEGRDDAGGDGARPVLTLAATITPDPPVVGVHTMTLEVVDAEGTGLSGATLEVSPQMPLHGHGSPDTPLVEDLGGGTYEARPVTFSMPGRWEVTVRAARGEASGEAVFVYDVE